MHHGYLLQKPEMPRAPAGRRLNKRPGVKADTRERVLRIAKEMNYQPNFLGKALVQSKETTKLAVILTPDYNPFIQSTMMGIRQAEEEIAPFGIQVSTKMLTSLDPAEQLQLLDALERDGYSGIGVFPIDDEAVVRKINAMSANGIVIVTFNSRIDSIHDLCFIGQDHLRGGRTAGGLMGRLLPEGGNIGIIISSRNLSCHKCRLEGFRQKISDSFPALHISGIYENQDKFDKAYEQTLSLCDSVQNLKGLYITGGGVAGVGKALAERHCSRQIRVICHDLIPETIRLLEDGTVDFAIGQSAALQGYQVVHTLFNYILRRKKPESSYIQIPVTITTEDNFDQESALGFIR